METNTPTSPLPASAFVMWFAKPNMTRILTAARAVANAYPDFLKQTNNHACDPTSIRQALALLLCHVRPMELRPPYAGVTPDVLLWSMERVWASAGHLQGDDPEQDLPGAVIAQLCDLQCGWGNADDPTGPEAYQGDECVLPLFADTE